TLIKEMKRARTYLLIDFSKPACDLVDRYAKELEFTAYVETMDVLEWLDRGWFGGHFDLACCFNLLEYLPLSDLETVLTKVPSDVLCLEVSVGEGYLRYDTRITAFARGEVEHYGRKHGWHVTKNLTTPDHTIVRLER